MSDEEMVFVNKTGTWFVWDPCGITCAVFTYGLLLYGVIVMFIVVVPAFPYLITWLNALLLVFIVFLCIVSHVKAMITNPGIVQRESATEEEVIERNQQGENLKYCKKCRSIKPDRAHHCSTCEHCVRRMDHHCPWINNCVGEFNQKYFVLFTFYVMIASFHGLLTIVVFFFSCLSVEFDSCDAWLPGPLIFVLMILGLFEGFLFILFTCTMFWSQIYSICTDETGIESIKHELRERVSWKEAMYEVFGSPCSFSWLNPFVPPPSLVMYLKHCTPMNV